MFTYRTIDSTNQKYFLSGQQPQIFILSGTHGDEFDIVPLVEQAVEKYAPQLPNFLYIPTLSPSATLLKTRNNGNNVNLNRSFLPNSNIPEVREIVKLLQSFKFDLVLNFHEDTVLHDFYFYDTKDLNGTGELIKLKSALQSINVGLYFGFDDPNDPALGYYSTEGYINYPLEKDDGGIDRWLKISNKMHRQIMPEIPGQISLDQKKKIIDIIFETLVLPEYGKVK